MSCILESVDTNNDLQRQLVTFQLGAEVYGIDIMDVREIVQMENIRQIPNAPVSMEGIFNLRGEIIPVINLHKRFHIKRVDLGEEDELMNGTIILNINNTKIGIIIDRVLRVLPIENHMIQPPPQILTGIGAEYIQGVIPNEDNYTIVLDIQRLFDPREIQQIGAMGR